MSKVADIRFAISTGPASGPMIYQGQKPSTAMKGDVYFDGSIDLFQVFDGAVWEPLYEGWEVILTKCQRDSVLR